MAKGRVIEVERGVARTATPRPLKPSKHIYVELPDEPPEDLFEYQDEQGSQYQDAALLGVLSELGTRDEDAKVVVKRVVNANGMRRMEWLFECPPAQFSVSDIQEHYGPGEYRVTVYGKQEGSNYKSIVHADKRVTIGEPKGGFKKPNGGAALAGVPAVAQPQDLTRAITEALAGPFTALAQTLAQVMPKATSRADTIAEMQQMAQLFISMRGNAAERADPTESLIKAMEFVKAATPEKIPVGDDGEVNPNFVLSQGISLLKEFFAAAREQRPPSLEAPASPAPQNATGAVPVVTTPKPAPTPEDAEMIGKQLMLKAQLALLLNAAQNDSDPVNYAALIYENAPDEVISTLQSENWFAELLKLAPEFAGFKPWAEKVRAEVLAIIAEESAPEGDAAPAVGIGAGEGGAPG